MSWRSRPEAWALLAVAALAVPRRGDAQGWREVQLWGAGLASRPAVFVAGAGLAWRDGGRTRIGGAIAAGTTDDRRTAARLEVAWHFLLDPRRQAGLSVYGGGGLALGVIEGDDLTPYLQLVLGIESNPGTPASVFVEGGFGGGVRLATGFRLRKQRRPAR